MPQRIQIESKEGHLHVEVSGVLDQARARRFIREILNACQGHELWKILADIRKIKGPIPDIARFKLAEFLTAEQTVLERSRGLLCWPCRLQSAFNTISDAQGY